MLGEESSVPLKVDSGDDEQEAPPLPTKVSRPGLSKAASVVSSQGGKSDRMGPSQSSGRRSAEGRAWAQKLFSRKNILRATLILGLMAAAGICAGLAYRELRDSEQEIAIQTYSSIANSALFGAVDITSRKLQGSTVMSTMLSYSIPDASTWPFIEINGYIPIAQSVADLSDSNTQSLMAFVQPGQLPDFEQHIQGVYEREGRPEGAGVSDFGFGVWKPDNENDPPMYEDGRIQDKTGEVSYRLHQCKVYDFDVEMPYYSVLGYV